MKKDELIALFSRYGYKIEEDDDKYIIFSLHTGMYPAIEIVPFRNDSTNEIKEKKNHMHNADMLLK